MEKKAAPGIMLILLLVSTLLFAFNVQKVGASGTIYIRADGSVDPPTAPILREGDIYTFTGNINDSIVIQRDNVVVDGADHTLQGSGSGTGVYLSYRNNVTVKNVEITAFVDGISLLSSTSNLIYRNNITNNNRWGIRIGREPPYGPASEDNVISRCNIASNQKDILLDEWSTRSTISENIITNSLYGIWLWHSSDNTISDNGITSNERGIYFYASLRNIVSGNNLVSNDYCLYLKADVVSPTWKSEDNRIFHNNLVGNLMQAYVENPLMPNFWDDGYPSGGNYWSDYADVDLYSGPYQNQTDCDGVWDHPYEIDAYNQDSYPLVSPWTPTPIKKPVVVLVHGFQSGEYNPDDIWSDVKSGLSYSFTVYVSHYAYDTATALSIKEYAGNLQREIAQIMQEEGVDKVDIIAHSMGGLVARWYIEMGNGDEHVRKLIMLETPNQGCNKVLLPLAVAGVDPEVITFVDELLRSLKFALLGIPLPLDIQAGIALGSISASVSARLFSWFGTALGMMMYWDSVKEMTSNSKLLKILESNYAANFKNKVDYSSLGGWLYEISWLKAFDLDGVSKETVSDISDPIAGYHGNLPKNPKIIQRIREILLGSSLSSADIYALESNAENDVETQWTISIPGEISSGEERLHAIPISSATATNFILVGSGGDLNLTLITPNGTLIDASFAGYYRNENLTIEGYIVANPEPGIWNASITGVGISENQSYVVMVALNSNMTLSIPFLKHQYDPGETLNITAVLSFGNHAVVEASVTAKIRIPDGTIGNIALYDDGLHGDNLTNDGIYSNRYTNSSSFGTYEITATANGTIDSGQFTRESFAFVWVEQYPDLSLSESDIYLSEETPLEGRIVTVNATIHNLGQADAVNASVLFYSGSPAEGTLIGEFTVNVTASGLEKASTQWNATHGAHEIYVLVSPYNQFQEENYTNNMACKSVYVFRHDIAVQNLSLSKTIIGQSFSVNITALTKNQGEFVETFNVTVYANTTMIETKEVTLTSGNSTIMTFVWNTTDMPKGNYTMSGYAEPVVEETYTVDNIYTFGTVTIVTPGDVNADRIVDVLDAAEISAHWHPGPPIGPLGYGPNFDINDDGVVNISDAAIVSAYWTGPPKGPLVP